MEAMTRKWTVSLPNFWMTLESTPEIGPGSCSCARSEEPRAFCVECLAWEQKHSVASALASDIHTDSYRTNRTDRPLCVYLPCRVQCSYRHALTLDTRPQAQATCRTCVARSSKHPNINRRNPHFCARHSNRAQQFYRKKLDTTEADQASCQPAVPPSGGGALGSGIAGGGGGGMTPGAGGLVRR